MFEGIKELGVKRTPADPDGHKHRLGFWAFVVGMLLLITVLIIVKGDAAQAGAYRCQGPISGKSPDAASSVDYGVKLTVNRWCGSPAGWDGGAPGFDRQHFEGPLADWSKWFDTKTQQGTGVAPNGTGGVKYKAIWIAGEHTLCIGIGPARVCTHHTHGVRIWAWANGNYTIKDTNNSIPNVVGGMPRP